MKKVVIITNIPSPYRVDLFKYLQNTSTEHEFSIMFSSTNEDNRGWKFDLSTLKNYYFLKSKTIKIKKKMDIKYIHIPHNVKEILDKIRPDVVIGCEYNPSILQAIMWCKRKHVNYISWTDGTLNSEKNINLIQKLSRKYVIRNAKAYIASSSKSKEAQIFYGANPNSVHLSYLTVDIDVYTQNHLVDKKFKILYVGRLVKGKGIDLLLNALSQIDREYNLVIVGDGDEFNNLKKQTELLNINNKVEFLGFLQREELKKYYATSNVFMLPTLNDCYGLVILEAMCSGIPIISSKYAEGVFDLVVEGENGFIVDPFDANEISNAILKLMDNNVLANTMGEASKRLSEKFKFEKVAQGFIEAIQEACKL